MTMKDESTIKRKTTGIRYDLMLGGEEENNRKIFSTNAALEEKIYMSRVRIDELIFSLCIGSVLTQHHVKFG